MAESGKVHVVDRDEGQKNKVNSGDVIRIVDSLSPDERVVVEQLRSMGPYKVHDARAQLLERLAASARANADAIKLTDMYPFLTGEPEPIQPSWALGSIVMSAIVVVVVVAAYANLAGRVPPYPTPSLDTEAAALPPQTIEKRSSRRGRVEQTPRMSALLADPPEPRSHVQVNAP
jgi:hypothetical protein